MVISVHTNSGKILNVYMRRQLTLLKFGFKNIFTLGRLFF